MAKTLSITLNPKLLYLFHPILQQGVIINTLVGRTIKDLLSQTLGITPEYMENRIQTVFLDGKAVDDLDSAVIHDGSVLALSGALPGLVGATLRRGGTYASLRRAITLSGEKADVPRKEGRVVVKLFNILVPELAPVLLAHGFWLTGGELERFLEERDEKFWNGCEHILVEGRETDVMILKEIKWSHIRESVLVQITPASLDS
jgi:hypothetical protein